MLDAVCGAGKARSAGDAEGAEKSGAAGTVVGAGEPVSAGRHVGKRGADGAADNAAVVSEDGVNFGPLTAYAGDDAEAARGILESFAEQSTANCRLLERALESGDVAALRAVAHKMLPIFTMLGAAGVAATLRTAESWEGPLTDALRGEIGAAVGKYPCDCRGSAKKGIFALSMERILIIDDDITFALMLKTWLSKKGFRTETAASVAAARTALAEGGFSLVLSDMRLPDEDGIALLQWMSGQHMEIPVIVMTSYAEIQNAVRCMKLGARDYVAKPVNPDELLKKIREALDVPAAGSEKPPVPAASAKKPREERPNYIEGRSDAAQRLYEYVRLVAPTNMSVLVTGASGTGKEHVAQLIHRESRRAGKPFVAVDCGAIGRELAASEFFGHVKGSFTGAVGDKTGAFEAANGGTLFLGRGRQPDL